ncbi:MAG: MFS transporter, partial [Streptosporangiaceae bacterium]
MAPAQIAHGPQPPAAPARRQMWRQGPLAGRYAPSAAMVVLFLVPYLGLSSALQPLAPIIASQLHMSPQAISLTGGVANAGYAVGTVLAVQLAQLLPQRRLLLVYASGLVIGSVLAAAATGPAMFIAGHVLQGLFTSMLLIASAPPLFLGFPLAKLRWTAVILNMCIFGAVAAGPLVGGAQASFHAWRPLFWIVAGIAAAGLLMSVLTFQDAPAADPSAPRDGLAIALAATGSVAAFWGAAELLTHRFLDPVAVVPLLVGLVLIATLWVYQYTAKRPLLTVRALASTIPVSGVIVAVCAAAAATSAIALTASVLSPRYPPLHLGLLYVPELVAAVVTAVAFGAVFSRRLIHYFALTGMAFLVAGILVLRSAIPPTETLTLVGSGLIGVGIGASVTPALFLAGFSLRSASIQRVFAILELLRAVAAFLIVPILLHFATTLTGLATPAMNTALWICFGLAAGGAIVGIMLYLLARLRPPAPALQRWMGSQEPAWDSPPLLAAVRGKTRPALAAASLAVVTAGESGGRRAAALAAHPRRHVMGEHADGAGPVLIAYDGSDLAGAAIAEAGEQLPGKREAVVLTVWRTFGVGFMPEPGAKFDAACADDVRQAAEQTAEHGAALAESAGFRATPLAVEGTPAWQTVIHAAYEQQASLIVIGSHGHGKLGRRIADSVAANISSRSDRPVLVVHPDGLPDGQPPQAGLGRGAVDVGDGVCADRGHARARQHDARQVQRIGGRQVRDLAVVLLPADRLQHLDRVRMGVLLAAEAGHEPAAPDRFPRLHPPERPQHVPPRHREGLPGDQVTKDHSPASRELLGDSLGQLVPVGAGNRRRQQRPAARGARAGPQAAPQSDCRGVPFRAAAPQQHPDRAEAVRGDQPAGDCVPQRLVHLGRQSARQRGQVRAEQRALRPQRVQHVPGPAAGRLSRGRVAAGRAQQPRQVIAQCQGDRRGAGRRQPASPRLGLGPRVHRRRISHRQPAPASLPRHAQLVQPLATV